MSKRLSNFQIDDFFKEEKIKIEKIIILELIQ